MTFGKLLGAASAVAMLAGTASAQLIIEQVNTTGTLSDGTTPIGGASTINVPYRLAEEVDFAALTLAGGADAVFGLVVRTQGVIPPGQNIFLTIEIENGTLFANLDGSEILSGITGAVVDDGGSIGDDFVRYLITTDTLDISTITGEDGIVLDLPVLLSSCADLTFNVTEFRTEGTGGSGTDIEGGTATLPVPALRCEDAYEATFIPDFRNTVLDFTTGFTEFLPNPDDSATEAKLGELVLTRNPVNIDLNGTSARLSDVIGFEADVNFSDISGISSARVAPGPSVGIVNAFFNVGTTTPTGDTIELVRNAASPNQPVQTGNFFLTIDGTTPITPQEVTVTNANLFLNTGLNLQPSDPFLPVTDAEDLKVNGQFYGFFDWVADTNGFVNSIFRISGLDGLSDIPAQLIVKNAQGGPAYDGTYAFTILASDVEGSEVRLNSDALSAIVGTTAPDGLFRTADIALVISTDLDLDVDRLLSGPAQATVVPFGDGANQDGTGALAPATDPANGVNGDDGSF